MFKTDTMFKELLVMLFLNVMLFISLHNIRNTKIEKNYYIESLSLCCPNEQHSE